MLLDAITTLTGVSFPEGGPTAGSVRAGKDVNWAYGEVGEAFASIVLRRAFELYEMIEPPLVQAARNSEAGGDGGGDGGGKEDGAKSASASASVLASASATVAVPGKKSGRRRTRVFYDVGCGRGKIVLLAACMRPLERAEGIDIAAPWIDQAHWLYDTWWPTQPPTLRAALDDGGTAIRFRACDATAMDAVTFEDGDVVFCNNVRFSVHVTRFLVVSLERTRSRGRAVRLLSLVPPHRRPSTALSLRVPAHSALYPPHTRRFNICSPLRSLSSTRR